MWDAEMFEFVSLNLKLFEFLVVTTGYIEDFSERCSWSDEYIVHNKLADSHILTGKKKNYLQNVNNIDK